MFEYIETKYKRFLPGKDRLCCHIESKKGKRNEDMGFQDLICGYFVSIVLFLREKE